MTARRLEPIRKPVTIRVDGRRVVADEGEPVAVALVADGRWLFGRSVKYHRPRGPVCFDGRCDGCLMRVDGAPNVMTCRVAAREGMDVHTQNVLGSAEQDLLSVTDWFFPHGLDHHEMFTRFKPVNQVMQKVARRIAGIGELPDRTEGPHSVREEDADVLVLGGGAAGLAAASEAAMGGLRVWLLEERASLRDQLASLESEARARNVVIAFAHEAVAIFEHTVLVKAPDGLMRFRTPRVVVATGSHEGPLAVAGNDRPGVLTPSGLVALLRNHVVPGKRVAVVGEGPRASDVMEIVSLAGSIALGPFPEKVVLRVLGSKAVSGIEIVNGRESARLTCDVVVMAGAPSAAFELAAQGGAGVRWHGGQFTVDASHNDGATVVPWLRAVGGCTGLDDLDAIVHQARAAGRAVAAELAQTKSAS